MKIQFVITDFLSMAGHILNREQQVACDVIVNPGQYRVVFVSGGPGQGKTATGRRAIAELPLTTPIAFFASTGSATTLVDLGDRDAEGMTIALFLGIFKAMERYPAFRREIADRHESLRGLARMVLLGERRAAHGRVIIDEFSMVSLSDMNTLFTIFRGMPNVVFVLTGDPEQLRNPGSMPFHRSAELQELVKAGRVASFTLVENFRFNADPPLGKAVDGFRFRKQTPELYRTMMEYMYRPRPSLLRAFEKGQVPVFMAADNNTVNQTNWNVVKTYIRSFGKGNVLDITVYPFLHEKDEKGAGGELIDQPWAPGVRGTVTQNLYVNGRRELTNGDRFVVRSVYPPETLNAKNKVAMVVALDSGGDSHIEAFKHKGKWTLNARVAYVETIHRWQGREISADTPVVLIVTSATNEKNWLVAISRLKTLKHLYIDVRNMSPNEAYELMFTARSKDDGMVDFLRQPEVKPVPGQQRLKRKRATSIFV